MKLKTQFDFDSAHRLVGYKGKCHQLHGHLWTVIIEIEGPKCDLDKVGILWDFTKTKELKNLLDHKTLLKACSENDKLIDVLQATCGVNSVYVMDENPTAENLVWEILNWCKSDAKHLLGKPNLNFKIRVYESPKSYAEGEL